jgi:hypothetical protein
MFDRLMRLPHEIAVTVSSKETISFGRRGDW